MTGKINDYVKRNKLIADNDSVILGVSGGADSVCLLIILNELSRQMQLELTVVHVNHGLRGIEAWEDCEFVRQLCKKLQVEFREFTFDAAGIAKSRKISVEEAGRCIRYETFEQVRQEKKASKIAVAHNKNDNAETILLSLFRGTGITGLTGIRPVREHIIRPLLCVSRAEIEEFLNAENISYRTDKSNFEDIYSRNKIRLNILPEIIEGINSQAVNHIINAGEQLREIEEYLEVQTKKEYLRLVKSSSVGLEIKSSGLVALDIVLQKRIIKKAVIEAAKCAKDISGVHIMEVLNLFLKHPGKQISLPYGVTALRTYDSVVIIEMGKEKEKQEFFAVKVSGEGKYTLPEGLGIVSISIKNRLNMKENMKELYTKCLDYDKIESDLLLRTRLEGDYFIIDSFGHKKKLKSFFIDSKIPREERDKIPLLAQGSHILWIAGYRISAGCRVTENTVRVLEVRFDGGHDGQNN